MSSALRSPKVNGDALEADTCQGIAALEYVPDGTAEWHDAKIAVQRSPDERLPYYGICVAEEGTPVEIKGCQYAVSNGDGQTKGRFYIKRRAHDRLVSEGGLYLLVVYLPRQGLPQLARVLVTAEIVDELLEGRWSTVAGDRSEQEVAKLSWGDVIEPESVDPSEVIR